VREMLHEFLPVVHAQATEIRQPRFDSGIPPPERFTYGFAQMQVGQSFAVGEYEMPNARNASYQYARRQNKRNQANNSSVQVKFSTRRVPGTNPGMWRIYRIK